jgi:hypothetical protein
MSKYIFNKLKYSYTVSVNIKSFQFILLLDKNIQFRRKNESVEN